MRTKLGVLKYFVVGSPYSWMEEYDADTITILMRVNATIGPQAQSCLASEREAIG